jgi:hypothetical protein
MRKTCNAESLLFLLLLFISHAFPQAVVTDNYSHKGFTIGAGKTFLNLDNLNNKLKANSFAEIDESPVVINGGIFFDNIIRDTSCLSLELNYFRNKGHNALSDVSSLSGLEIFFVGQQNFWKFHNATLYPALGFGLSAYNLRLYNDSLKNPSFQKIISNKRESDIFDYQVLVSFSAGFDKGFTFFGEKNKYVIGLRAGYKLALFSNFSFYHKIKLSDIPAIHHDGFYITAVLSMF